MEWVNYVFFKMHYSLRVSSWTAAVISSRIRRFAVKNIYSNHGYRRFQDLHLSLAPVMDSGSTKNSIFALVKIDINQSLPWFNSVQEKIRKFRNWIRSNELGRQTSMSTIGQAHWCIHCTPLLWQDVARSTWCVINLMQHVCWIWAIHVEYMLMFNMSLSWS